MTDKRARVDQAVFEFLRPELNRYRGDVEGLTSSVAHSIAHASSHAESVVSERRRQLDSALNELQACLRQEDADCSGCKARVEERKRALDSATQGRNLIAAASSSFLRRQATYRSTVDQLLLRAEKVVRVADERTTNYQHVDQLGSAATTGGGSGLTGAAEVWSPSWRDLPGVSVPTHFPDGFALIPVDLIVVDGSAPPTDLADTGQDAFASRWSADALFDVVLPALSSTVDACQYLSDRDTREVLSGGRSYSATYSDYFSPDSAIGLAPGPAGFDVVNGHRRLQVLMDAGAQCVPALIGGG